MQRQRRKRRADILLEPQEQVGGGSGEDTVHGGLGVVCDRCCLLATEGKTCLIPSESTLPAGAASLRVPSQLPKHQSAGLRVGWIFTSFPF